jgi:predicted lipoprotein
VRDRSADVGARLEEAALRLLDAMADLPDSSVAALADRPRLEAAADAAARLKVLGGTEVASQLGVTIGFSDADGDS